MAKGLQDCTHSYCLVPACQLLIIFSITPLQGLTNLLPELLGSAGFSFFPSLLMFSFGRASSISRTWDPPFLTVLTPLKSSSVQPIPCARCIYILPMIEFPPLIHVLLKPHANGQTLAFNCGLLPLERICQASCIGRTCPVLNNFDLYPMLTLKSK